MKKRCSKCKQKLSFSKFNKDKSKKDKLAGQCKDCRKIYRGTHKVEIAKRDREYHQAHKTKIAERKRKYCQKHC